VVRWREDILDKNGRVVRSERRAAVGTLEELPTKPLARRAADKIIEHLNAPDYMPGRVTTVADFADVYMRDVASTFKPSSCEAARSICRIYLVPILGQYRLNEIKGQVPQLLINELRHRALSPKTIRNAVSTLASMLTAARDWNYLATTLDWGKLRLPVDNLEKPQRIIDVAPEPWNLCFMFMAYLGIRAGEAVAIAWDHIDLDARVLMVRQSNWRGQLLTVKSKASRRDLPLPEALVSALADYRRRWKANPHGLLFANHKGQPITSCYVRRDVLHPIRERLNIPRGAFHAFRHGHATTMFSSGANPKVVQDGMGHAHISTTMRYTHVVSEDRRQAVERAAQVFLRRSAANLDGKLLRLN
jgi:integrase